ncbi:MAG TPA: hypothetical protein VFK69_11005 [Candidatus Eisenbacteria bacterium]|nr:hypothetical protein [Candidatus Eisenbacteria bacterium]
MDGRFAADDPRVLTIHGDDAAHHGADGVRDGQRECAAARIGAVAVEVDLGGRGRRGRRRVIARMLRRRGPLRAGQRVRVVVAAQLRQVRVRMTARVRRVHERVTGRGRDVHAQRAVSMRGARGESGVAVQHGGERALERR